MAGSNSNPNTSFVISSVIKTIIMLVIVGAILYILKEHQADFYNQKIYSILTGKKLQPVAVAQASSQEYESGATGYVEGETNPIYDVQEIAPEVDNRVVVSSVKTSSTVKRVIIPGEEPKVKVPVVQNVQEEENISTQTPKFIDGYEVITIEDTEPPNELLRNTTKASSVKRAPQQQPTVQQEEVYAEEEIPADYDGPNWAAVAVNTDIYNKEKNKIGVIPGGIIVETSDHVFVKNGALIHCRQIKDGVVNQETDFYVLESDLVMFRGPYNNKVHPDKTTIIEFCKVRGQYQKLLDELRKEELKKNPYFNEYKEAVAAYKNMKKESDELEEKRKTTSGAAKANLEDKIHRLKIEEVSARKTLNDAQRKYDAWRNKNLGTGEEIKITPTPELNKLKSEMDALFPRANEICPGI